MDWHTLRVSVAPGDAVVARVGAAIVVVDATLPAHEEFLDSLLALCSAADQTTAPDTGTAFLRDVGRLVLDTAAERLPPFAMATAAETGLATIVAGPMELRVSRIGGSEDLLDGTGSSTYLDRIVSGDVDHVLLTRPGSAAAPDPRSNLTGGVVRGGGVLLVPGASAARAQEDETLVDLRPAPGVPHSHATEGDLTARADVADQEPSVRPSSTSVSRSEETPFTSISLFGGTDGAPPKPEAESVGDQPVGERSPSPVPRVQGIMCSRSHFNSPEARFCTRCGISMVHQTHNLVTGPRPPLGVLVLDDGSVHALTADYVLGRDPESANEVREGSALPLLLQDPDLTLSRVHARVILDGWEVRVEDAGSANGTFVAASPDDEWQRLASGIPTTIAPGCRILMGSRQLSFESHQRS